MQKAGKVEGSAGIIVNNKTGLQARKHCGKGMTAEEWRKRVCGRFTRKGKRVGRNPVCVLRLFGDDVDELHG